MDRTGVDDWLRRYVAAWKSYDRAEVTGLFTGDAEYRWHPWDEPARGPDAIYEGWVAPDARDEPGTYDAAYRAVAVDGDRAVATGTSTYHESPGGPVRTVYYNCFVMEFEGDRCKSFTEWFMERPK
jgi:hypothetical protein